MLSTYFALDYIILYIFLAVTLITGVWAGRNIRDIRDYALAGKTFGVGALTMTFLATYLDGANTIGIQKSILEYGIILLISRLVMFIVFILIATYLAPKLVKNFKDSLTFGDIMNKLYGRYGSVLTAIIGTYYTVFMLASQLGFIGSINKLFLEWPASFSILAVGLVLIIYSSFGGIRAITITDILQFIIFIAAVSMICNIAIKEAGGLKVIFHKLPPDKLSIVGNRRFSHYLSGNIIWAFSLFVYPAIIHRILMAKTSRDASNMLVISGLLSFIIIGLITLASLAVLILNPATKASVGGTFSYIIKNYFGQGLRIFSVLGMLSIVMSTIDSVINSGSLLLTHNLIIPLLTQKGAKINELKLVKYISFMLGFVGLVIAYIVSITNTEINKVTYFGPSLLTPMLAIPFIAGVLGLKTDSTSFIISSITTMVAFIIVNFLVSTQLQTMLTNSNLALPICIAINAITFFTTHLIKNRGFLIIQNDEHKLNTHHLITPSLIIAKLINSIIYLPLKINNHLKEQMNNYELNHLAFGLFMSCNYMIPYFISDIASINDIFVIKLIGACLCVGLLLQPYWSTYFYDKFFHLYWNFTLLYCLPFSTSLFYILNNGNTLWAVNLAFAIMLLMALVDWKSFIVIIILGTILAMSYAKQIIMIPKISYEEGYDWCYIVFYAVSISLLFVRRKEKAAHQTIEENKELQLAKVYAEDKLMHELEQPNRIKAALGKEGINLTSNLQLIKSQINDLLIINDQDSLNLAKQKIDTVFNFFTDLTTKVNSFIKLKLDNALLTKIIEDSIRYYPKTHSFDHFSFININFKYIQCDIDKIKTVIHNSIKLLLIDKHQNHPLNFFVNETMIGYNLKQISNYTKKIPAVRILITYKHTPGQVNTLYLGDLYAPLEAQPKKIDDFPKMENKHIIKAHYGLYNQEHDSIEIILPVMLSQIRPKKMDLVSTDEFPEEPIIEHISTKKVEQRFFNRLLKKAPNIDLEQVRKALDFTKKYHYGQFRKTGEPFYYHPIRVAETLINYSQEQDAILAALLHDLVEDTRVSIEQISAFFNPKVASIVDDLTKLTDNNILISDEENKIKLDQVTNLLSLYIKIADRIDNIRTIKGHISIAKRHEIVNETVNYFYPLAQHIGMKQAANELMDLSFDFLNETMMIHATTSPFFTYKQQQLAFKDFVDKVDKQQNYDW
jgi:Na+/proline symporter